MNHIECIIAGNGIIGLTAALALNQKGIEVAIIAPDYTKPPNHSVCAINHLSKTIWENLNVWSQLEPYTSQIKHMQLNCLGSELLMHAIQHQKNELGWILPNHITKKVLTNAVKSKNIPLIQDHLDNIQLLEDSIQCNFKHHETLEAEWVLATDGRNSNIKKQLNLPSHQVRRNCVLEDWTHLLLYRHN